MKPCRKTDQRLVALITDLRRRASEEGAPIWRDVAERLNKPSRNWAQVNVSRIARFSQKGDVVLVPGKLLGGGDIDFPVTVAAYKASASAVKKITGAGGKVVSIPELVEENPKGSGVRIMG
ncbi:MAG: 50S ribosomal protein L18e [Thermoplasmata archaeon]|nr:50S ribosomal protein L18e [Thermoplasmata archaeon]